MFTAGQMPLPHAPIPLFSVYLISNFFFAYLYLIAPPGKTVFLVLFLHQLFSSHLPFCRHTILECLPKTIKGRVWPNSSL